jgi:hypothetical protein
MFMLSHLLKTYIRNPSLFFIFFNPPIYRETNDGNHDPHAHIYARRCEFC